MMSFTDEILKDSELVKALAKRYKNFHLQELLDHLTKDEAKSWHQRLTLKNIKYPSLREGSSQKNNKKDGIMQPVINVRTPLSIEGNHLSGCVVKKIGVNEFSQHIDFSKINDFLKTKNFDEIINDPVLFYSLFCKSFIENNLHHKDFYCFR